MSPPDSAAFSPAAEELIAQLHDIVHEEGWDAPVGIAWLLSDEGEDAPPHAALEELANSGLFTSSSPTSAASRGSSGCCPDTIRSVATTARA